MLLLKGLQQLVPQPSTQIVVFLVNWSIDVQH